MNLREGIGRSAARWMTEPRFWIVTCLALLICSAVHLVTLTISPVIWFDEVLVIDYGRVLLNGAHSSWSVNWDASHLQPLVLWTYLGTIPQELAYRTTAPSPAGPRLVSLVGAILAALATIGWLRSRRVPHIPSVLLGLTFFLDPLFVMSYRGARVDSWVFALCIGSAWMIRSTTKNLPGSRVWSMKLLGAGCLAAVAFWVFPTAPVLYPLILSELWLVARSARRNGTLSSLLRPVLLFTGSGIVFAAILLLPMLPVLGILMKDFEPIFGANAPRPGIGLQVEALLASYKYSPFVPICAICVAPLLAGDMALAVAFLVTFVYILSSRVYAMHVIYFLPYLVGLLGGAYSTLHLMNRSNRVARLMGIGLVWLVLFAAGVTLLARPVTVLRQASQRQPSILVRVGRSAIGAGPHRVLIGAVEFYYAGRDLGWHMYYAWSPVSRRQELRFVSNMQYVVFRPTQVSSATDSLLLQAGFHHRRVLLKQAPVQASWLTKLSPGQAEPYGPYVLYSR
jgi:hypothetical protein